MGTSAGATNMVTEKKRNINNIRFCQGRKNENSLDVLLVEHFEPILKYATEKRSMYYLICIHNTQGDLAGKCDPCKTTAKQRIMAVAKGHYSISWSEAIPGYGYCARYATEDGEIIRDIFKSYSEPEVCCVLQCLMSNVADLHPLFIAEDSNLFWPIIWYYGSVFNAISQCCDIETLSTVYGSAMHEVELDSNTVSFPDEILSAFPEHATDQIRISCGNDKCPQLDHQSKFKQCSGCKVRHYCDRKCQMEDFQLHKKECKAERNRNENATEN